MFNYYSYQKIKSQSRYVVSIESWKRILICLIDKVAKGSLMLISENWNWWDLFFELDSHKFNWETVLASIDKWIISNKTGTLLFLGKRGRSFELKTLPFQGSISIILWILSNGWYFCKIVQNNINRDIFLQFWNHFET